MVPRTLKITGSDLYGLPASFDDEVILGLINLTRLQGFKSREVLFNRHQIISVLGWKNDDYYYGRIKESIERWLGVTLYYDNAWREIGKKWKSGGFNLITSVSWGARGEPSKIIWGEDIFTSFEKGNLKALDLDIYRELSSPTARRLYRFLDKRFGTGKHTWTMKVDKLAFSKLGMERDSYKDVAQVKRQLLAAIKKLEEAQFLMSMPSKERFTKVVKGVWNVHFQKFRAPKKDNQRPLDIEIGELGKAESQLVRLGVSRVEAQKLVRQYGDERVLERVEVHDYLIKNKRDGWMRDKAATLIGSIHKDEYKTPQGFVSSSQKAAQAAQKAAYEKKKAKAALESQKKEKAENEALALERDIAWSVFENLSAEKQEEIRETAQKGFNFTNEKVIRQVISDEVQNRIQSGEIQVDSQE